MKAPAPYPLPPLVRRVAPPHRGAGIFMNSRLPQVLGAPADFRDRLATLAVAVGGVGSIGSRIALHLATLGLRRLGLFDPKSYKRESVFTHPIASMPSTTAKATWTAKQATKLCPRTRVEYAVARLQDLNPADLAPYDILLLASDNIAAEVAASRAARMLAIPMLQAAVQPESLSAQVKFYSASAAAACPGCQLGSPELNDPQATFSCGRTHQPGSEQPTSSFSFLCSLAADLALNQLIRHVLGLDPPVQNTVLTYCGLSHSTALMQTTRSATCPSDHRPFSPVWLSQPLASHSPAQLVRRAKLPARAAELRVDDAFAFADRLCCIACGRTAPAQRFIRRARPPACRCGHALHPPPFHALPAVTLAKFAAGGQALPLAALGAADVRSVVVTTADRGVVFFGPDTDRRSS